MAGYYQKTLELAEKRLDATPGPARTLQLVEAYRRFIRIEESRLLALHRSGGGGRDIGKRRSALTDGLLVHAFEQTLRHLAPEQTAQLHPMCLVANGGYGRSLLSPRSDIDIMFLHRPPEGAPSEPNPATAEAIRQILYLLWDAGFKLGHSVRTIAEAVAQSESDHLTFNSLLDARMLTGDPGLFLGFQQEFHAHCIRGHEKAYIAWRMEDQETRHAKHGRTVYLQEPNIKNGCGGLRDFQNLLWIAQVKYGDSKLSQLVQRGVLLENERRRLLRGYDFLLRVRAELHTQSKRPNEVLGLYFQGQIAPLVGYTEGTVLQQIENLMRDYYRHTRNIYLITGLMAERMALVHTRERTRRRPVWSFLARRRSATETFDGFRASHGVIELETPDSFRRDPHRMIRAFLHAQQRQISLGPDLQQRLHRRLYTVDRTFQYARPARETFEAILSRKGEVGRILRLMHELDFLGRYLPEFGALTCLVQHEFYHRYTADEHTLVCIENLDALLSTIDTRLATYQDIFRKLDDPFIPYLALILHDTGRGTGSGPHADASAINAQAVARRLRLSPQRRTSLILLVDNHTLLARTAQKSNLADPEVIRDFAERIRTQENLDALLLMTIADSQATSPDMWNDWKSSLCLHLYRSASLYLADPAAYEQSNTLHKDQLLALVAQRLPADYQQEIQAHFNTLPNRYFRAYDADTIHRHLRLIRKFFRRNSTREDTTPGAAIAWNAIESQGASEVLICTWDREQLLARIVGSFAAAQLNILSADIHSREDNIVLDVFRVCTAHFAAVTDPAAQTSVESALNHALAHRSFDFAPAFRHATASFPVIPPPSPLAEAPAPLRVHADLTTSPRHTIIEVQAADRLGLLYDLVMAFYRHDVRIVHARIATERGIAINAFSLTDLWGRKITDDAWLLAIRKTIASTARLQ